MGDPRRGRQTFQRYVEVEWLPNHMMEATTREGYTYSIYKHIMPCFLSAVFTTALNDQVTFLHPCRGVKTPTVPPVPMTIVTPEQFDAIYQALPDAGAQLLVEAAIETGLRWGNSLNCGHGT
jgi:hypothetical protein